jgi:hypothetical protein
MAEKKAVKAPASGKINLKAPVKKSKTAAMPRLAANHNETLLVA